MNRKLINVSNRGVPGWFGVGAGLLVLMLGCSPQGDVFHVAPDGNDDHPGTRRQPFATIAAARDAARAVPGERTIVLAPGRYFHTGPVVFDDRDSGVTLRGAEPGATAEVYGGVPVTGWERWQGDIWRAPVPQGERFFNLVVDGEPATMAQTPNAGSGFRGAAQHRGNAAVWVPPEWRGYDYADAQVFGFLGANWFSEMRTVLAASPNEDGILPIDPGSGLFGGMNHRFFLRGVLEFLDEPGEWCLKHEEGYVYYWPLAATPDDHLIVRPTTESFLQVRGRSPETPARDVTIDNLSIIGSDFSVRWHLFGQNEDGSTPEPFRHGLVFAENVERLRVLNSRILAAGHAGVWLNHHARDSVVESCLVAGAGFAGVYANGYIPGKGPFTSGPESHVNRGHRIENNFIYDCGKFIGGGCGIQFYQTGDSLITRNEVGEMPRYGISFKSIHWAALPKNLYGHELTTFGDHYDYIHTRDLRVIGNRIYSVCRNSYDFGAIESWGVGRDNLWADNHLHDIDQAVNWGGWAHVLFSDDASDYLTVRGNLIHHCRGGHMTGAFMLKSVEQTIENNLVVDCDIGRLITFEPFILPAWDMTIRHNIFAVDGVNTRYGNINHHSIHGKDFHGVPVPEGSRGFREVNHNWVNPRDPNNPNPLAHHGMDLDSIFGPAPVERRAPFWDALAEDYVVTDPPEWFEPLATAQMGLRDDFPFDTEAWKRRSALRKIQAQGYQRAYGLRTEGGTGIHHLVPGSWAKYANIDFGEGPGRAVFALRAATPEGEAAKRFVHRSGETLVEEIPFKADMSVETVRQWEVSRPYTVEGKTGPELFDAVLPPEEDPEAGEWQLYLEPPTSRAGYTPDAGVVDFDLVFGEENRNAAAYARAAIHAPIGRTNATMTITAAGGFKVWFNGELIMASKEPGTHSFQQGVIREGWNTVLVKVNQGTEPGGFSFSYGTVASSCGRIVALPGRPEAAEVSGVVEDALVELRVGSPEGDMVGQLHSGQTTCEVAGVEGVQDLYLVFPVGQVNHVDWFRFEP